MRITSLYYMLGFILAGALLSSCTEAGLEEEVFDTAEARGPNRNGNNNQGVGQNATSQLIEDWNSLWLEVDRHATGMRPTATARALGYIHLAAFETAAPQMVNYTSNVGRLRGFRIDENRSVDNFDLNIALNATYAKVIDHFMFNVPAEYEAQISRLRNQKEGQLSNDLPNNRIQESRRWGEYIADQVIAYSLTDRQAQRQIREAQPTSYEPPVGDGYWTYSDDAERALFPYWESVRTFVISSEETTSIAPPIAYDETVNSPYYNQMVEVMEVNNTAREEDNDDLWIAEFWSDDVEGLMMSPPGRQISIANQLVDQFDLDHETTLAMLLRLGFALNDAAVSSWADKYEYMVMRPNVYIQEHIDPDYQTNLYRLIYWPNPSFPGYPSGHSTFASAAGGVFIGVFGDQVNFTDRSHEGRTEFRGRPRQFNTISEMAEENAYSRIPFGVHVRMDCTEGYRLGYEISDAVNRFDLTSEPNL